MLKPKLVRRSFILVLITSIPLFSMEPTTKRPCTQQTFVGNHSLLNHYNPTTRWLIKLYCEKNDIEQCKVLKGHSDVVRTVAISSDGRIGVSGSYDKTVRVWNLETGACKYILQKKAKVQVVAITPDGKLGLAAPWDQLVYLWDLETGTYKHILHGHISTIQTIVVTADGKQAYTLSDAESLAWNLETGACINRYESPGCCYDFALDPNRMIELAGSSCLTEKPTAKVTDLKTNQTICELQGHTAPVVSVAMTDDMTGLTGSDDRTIRIWDLKTGQQLSKIDLTYDDGPAYHVTATPDGTLALTGSKKANVWDLKTGQLLATLGKHYDHVSAVALTPDGTVALTGDISTVRAWIIRTPRKLREMLERLTLTQVALLTDINVKIQNNLSCHVRAHDGNSNETETHQAYRTLPTGLQSLVAPYICIANETTVQQQADHQ